MGAMITEHYEHNIEMLLFLLVLLVGVLIPSHLLAAPSSSPSASQHFQEGNALYAANDLQGALVSYREAILIEPNADVFCNLASVFYDLQALEESENNYIRAIQLEPSHAPALFNYALLLQDKSAHKKAAELYERLLGVEENNADALSNLGSCYYEVQRYREAVEVFHRAAELYEHIIHDEETKRGLQSNIFEYIGRCFTKLGETDKAKSYLNEAVSLNPGVFNIPIAHLLTYFRFILFSF